MCHSERSEESFYCHSRASEARPENPVDFNALLLLWNIILLVPRQAGNDRKRGWSSPLDCHSEDNARRIYQKILNQVQDDRKRDT